LQPTKTACFKTVVLQFESVIFVDKFRKKKVFSQPDGLQLQEVGDFEVLNCLPPKT